MSEGSQQDASTHERTLAALSELIDALDRRVPKVERLGEVRIAREAAALRQAAATRIKQLKVADRGTREAELADAVMADDGGPRT